MFDISSTPSGNLTATMYSPDQTPTGFPADTVTLNADSLQITIPSIAGVYEGRISGDEDKIEGTWKQMGNSFRLVLNRSDKKYQAEEPVRPQEPQKPYPYQSVDITFKSNDGTELSGTLCLPQATSLSPGVVLIAGSGPMDRNETIADHRPFLVISDYLCRHGIGVLRYDKRGVGASGGNFEKASADEFVADAEAAYQALKNQPGVDSSGVGILGHSEGGLIAPEVANQANNVVFLVLMAAPGEKGESLLYQQNDLIARAEGVSDSLISANRQRQEQLFSILKQNPDNHQASTQLLEVLQMAGLPDEIAQKQAQQLTTPWFRWFLDYDPLPALEKLDMPVLALNGSKDLQVPPDPNLKLIRAALAKSDSKNVEVKELEGLNHLFQTAKTGSPSEYQQIEQTIDPAVLELLGSWIHKQLRSAQQK